MRHPVHNGVWAAADAATETGTPAVATTYTLDPGHTEVLATWTHFGFSRPAGMFYQIDGTLIYDASHPENSSVEVTIPVASLHTKVPRQDQHLQSAEFFDAAKFPDIHFKSTRVERGTAQDKLKVTGNLTVHGVTRPIVLDVTVNKVGFHELYQADAAGFDAVAQLNRSDFGVGAHVPLVSDRIDLRITAEAVERGAWKVIQSQQSK